MDFFIRDPGKVIEEVIIVLVGFMGIIDFVINY